MFIFRWTNLLQRRALLPSSQRLANATSLSDIGLARLAVSKKDFATAKAKAHCRSSQKATKVIAAPAGKSAAYGQAFYLMGMVHESEETSIIATT